MGAFGTTEAHTGLEEDFTMHYVYQIDARKHTLPTKDKATVRTIRTVHDVDGGGQISQACGNGTLCVSTHDKEDPANENR